MGKNNKNITSPKKVKTEYKCPICRETHKMNEICPIVYKRLNKSKPENRVYIG